MDSVKKRLSQLYLQYEMATCLFMFEPWEKLLINFVIFSCALLMLFSSYKFLPNYLFNLLVIFGVMSDKPETGFQPIAA